MANPQIEEGYLKIANDYMDALIRTRIPGEARQLLDLIIRKTWGWSKKEDFISLSQFVHAVGISRAKIIEARKVLIKMNLIDLVKVDGLVKYRVNKNYKTWIPLPKKGVRKTGLGSPEYRNGESGIPDDVRNTGTGESGIPELGGAGIPDTQKTLLQKTLYKKQENVPADEEEILVEAIDEELSELLLAQILKHHPKWKLAKPGEQKKARKDWPLIIAKLRRIDFRSVEDIREMIVWATENDFWTGNIRGADSLRRNWDSMQAQQERDSKKLENMTDEAAARLVFENLKKRRGKA